MWLDEQRPPEHHGRSWFRWSIVLLEVGFNISAVQSRPGRAQPSRQGVKQGGQLWYGFSGGGVGTIGPMSEGAVVRKVGRIRMHRSRIKPRTGVTDTCSCARRSARSGSEPRNGPSRINGSVGDRCSSRCEHCGANSSTSSARCLSFALLYEARQEIWVLAKS